MGRFSFFKSRKPAKPPIENLKPIEGINTTEYLPLLWGDDYCQVEIVPLENKNNIQRQAEQIAAMTAKSGSEYGFTKIFERGPMQTPTISKEIRADYLENLLIGHHFPKAKHIKYESSKIIDCANSKTKAFGFSSFTIFFDVDDEFVDNIWITTFRGVTPFPLDVIKAFLYDLGESCELILIDWNSLELIHLANLRQIESYLKGLR